MNATPDWHKTKRYFKQGNYQYEILIKFYHLHCCSWQPCTINIFPFFTCVLRHNLFLNLVIFTQDNGVKGNTVISEFTTTQCTVDADYKQIFGCGNAYKSGREFSLWVNKAPSKQAIESRPTLSTDSSFYINNDLHQAAFRVVPVPFSTDCRSTVLSSIADTWILRLFLTMGQHSFPDPWDLLSTLTQCAPFQYTSLSWYGEKVNTMPTLWELCSLTSQ